MKLLMPITALSIFATTASYADALQQAVNKYNGLQGNMNARSYQAEFIANIMGDESVVLVAQEAHKQGVVISENGEEPSEDAIDSYNPAHYFLPPEDEMALLLPEDGYDLLDSRDGNSHYRFQPIMNVKGKYHKDSDKMTGELTVNDACACLVSMSMNSTDSFRQMGIKFNSLSTQWQFYTDDWRPKYFTAAFEGSAFFVDITYDENATWQYLGS